MVGKHKGSLARLLQIAPHINFTHCIIYRENLASKTLDQQLKRVLDSAVKIVNYIKSRPLQTRLFIILCYEMGSKHKTLLLYLEVRWLSRGKVLTRLYELRNEAYLFLTQRRHERGANLTNPDWLTKLLYLSCIFEKINNLNLSLQGEKSIDILIAYSKIKAFKKKIQHWASRVEIEKINMCSELNDYLEENKFNQRNVKQSVISHLRNLFQCFDKYFPEDIAPSPYWILSPSPYQVLIIYHQI